LNAGLNPGHRRIKLPLAIRFFGKAHGCQRRLQLLVFKRRQMAISIHGRNQEVEKRPQLGG